MTAAPPRSDLAAGIRSRPAGKVGAVADVTRPMSLHRRGFTLMELLIVLLVISALMALLIPTIGLVSKKRKEAVTRATMGKIEASLASYQSLNGGFPGSSKTGRTAVSGVTVRGEWTVEPGPDGVAVMGAAGAVAHLWPALQSVSADEFNRGTQQVAEFPLTGYVAPSGATSPTWAVIDAWGRPFRYLPAACYPSRPAGAQLDDPGWPNQVPRRDSYLLWSPGDDGMDTPWAGSADWSGMPMGGDGDLHNFDP